MEDLLTLLQFLNPNFQDFVTQEIRDESSIHGYNCFGREKDGYTFSGGTSSDKSTAIRIAIAEAFERSFVTQIEQNKFFRESFLYDEFPSNSGFAFGFNEKKTRFRAICEGLERWAWSKWIDENYQIRPIDKPEKLSKLSAHLISHFNECYWFKKDFSIQLDSNQKLDLNFVVFLGCTTTGIFPGSRVSTSADDLFEHPLIEAYRNLINCNLYATDPTPLRDIIQKRAVYFSTNKQIALESIKQAERTDWPKGKIKLIKKFETENDKLFMYRCLFEDFTGWHLGDVNRFVY